MHIQAFYHSLASAKEQDNLLQALRALSLIDDFKSLFNGEDTFFEEWVPWPPTGAEAGSEA